MNDVLERVYEHVIVQDSRISQLEQLMDSQAVPGSNPNPVAITVVSLVGLISIILSVGFAVHLVRAPVTIESKATGQTLTGDVTFAGPGAPGQVLQWSDIGAMPSGVGGGAGGAGGAGR
jgi:hypothetical protein